MEDLTIYDGRLRILNPGLTKRVTVKAKCRNSMLISGIRKLHLLWYENDIKVLI